jgi:hypothetical protein
VRPIRACLVLLATAAVFLVGALVASAADPCTSICLSVSNTDAASGEEVSFKITGTEAWSTYNLKVEDQVVARGSDPAGNGVDDKFKMPDLGSSEKDVTLTATVQQPSSPGNDFVGTTTMRYVLFPTSPTGPTTDTQPQPVPLEATPAPQSSPAPALTTTIPTTPSSSSKKKTTGTTTPHKHSSTKKQKQTSTGGTSTPTTTPTPAVTTFPSTTAPTSNPASHLRKTPTSVPQTPSGPVGTAGIQPPTPPSSAGTPPTSTPITGTATITKSGFPTGALIALALLALAALAVAASRVRYVDWNRFRIAFAGPHDPDEMRLGALARAARSGAEAQQAIALRKASRKAS